MARAYGIAAPDRAILFRGQVSVDPVLRHELPHREPPIEEPFPAVERDQFRSLPMYGHNEESSSVGMDNSLRSHHGEPEPLQSIALHSVHGTKINISSFLGFQEKYAIY